MKKIRIIGDVFLEIGFFYKFFQILSVFIIFFFRLIFSNFLRVVQNKNKNFLIFILLIFFISSLLLQSDKRHYDKIIKHIYKTKNKEKTNFRHHNLIKNADFSKDTAGFSSDIFYAPDNNVFLSLVAYNVLNNPQLITNNFSLCKDHTLDPEDKMLIINGGENSNSAFWRQTISGLEMNTTYHFTIWVCNINPVSLVQLQLIILVKEKKVASAGPFTPAVTCNWEQFGLFWDSGENTTITLELRNDNIEYVGNDFAIDDISFIRQ